ncbi:MAG: VOC family protein [Pseudomonadota bacterium]
MSTASARATFDHLVIAAASLAEGTAWVEDRLGVPSGGGGVHAFMGTHNALWRLGDAYIEVIAIDPAAPGPDRPRWLSLDAPETKARIAARPRLITWQIRPNRPLDDAVAAMAARGIDTGPPLDAARDDLVWRLTVRGDGALALGGLFPVMIEWRAGDRLPPQRLPETPLALERIEIAGAPGSLAPALADLGADGLAHIGEAGEPALRAHLDTPRGPVVLD